MKISNRVFGRAASVYIHWPFCKKICSYCNFNKYRWSSRDDVERITKCLQTEVAVLAERANIATVVSVYFGGGTPSLMDPSSVKSVTSTINSIQNLERSPPETSIEANPGDLSAEKIRAFSEEAGVNRLSIGIQALDNRDLTKMNRDHDVTKAISSLEAASDALASGLLKSFSADLIFGRPNQTLSNWEKELDRLLEVFPGLPHVALYDLMVERGTPLWKEVNQHGSQINMPSEELRSEMYEMAVEKLASHGLVQYEVSNFAKSPAHQCQHNLWYWSGGDYLGVGPGAHGRYLLADINEVNKTGRFATVQAPLPKTWMESVEKSGHGTVKETQQSVADVLGEVIVLSLRKTSGLTNDAWTTICERYGDLDLARKRVDFLTEGCADQFVKSGHLCVDDHGLRFTWDGFKISDHILPYLIRNLLTHFEST